MSATRSRRQPDEESVAQIPQTTPSGLGAGLPNHDFTLQIVIELQKSIGELNATTQATKSSVDGLKSKVDDLIAWKNRILGGAAALALVIAALGYVAGKVSEYVVLKPVAAAATSAQIELQAAKPVLSQTHSASSTRVP
jgi:hypothetical protein